MKTKNMAAVKDLTFSLLGLKVFMLKQGTADMK
jgi:hypothetical protein